MAFSPLPRPRSINGLILLGFGLVTLPLLVAIVWAAFQMDRLVGVSIAMEWLCGMRDLRVRRDHAGAAAASDGYGDHEEAGEEA